MFINLGPAEWQKYDVDWSEYEPRNRTFLNLGLPPVIQQRYRDKYASFWNDRLPDQLRNVTNMNLSPPYAEYYGPSSVPSEPPPSPASGSIPQRGTTYSSSRDPFIDGKINLYPNSGLRPPRPTDDDPYKLLELIRTNPRRYNVMAHPETDEEAGGSVFPSTTERIIIVNSSDIVEKADVTLYALIFMVVLLVLLLAAFALVLRKSQRRNKGDDANHKPSHETTTTNSSVATTDKVASSSDVDESYVISTMRNKKKPPPHTPNKYESMSFCRNLLQKYQRRRVKNQVFNQSNKVAEWMTSEELAKYRPQFFDSKLTLNRHSSFLGGGGTTTASSTPEKVSVAIDATPQNRSDSVLRQEPIEITKAKANYLHNNNDRIIICQEIDDLPSDMLNRSSYGSNSNGRGSYSSSDMSNCSDVGCKGVGCGGGGEQHQQQSINPVHGNGPYEQMMEMSLGDDEQVTSFIIEHEDINVTCREASVERDPLSPTETLSNIQRRKFPKVLPDYHPAKNKRHSLPYPSTSVSSSSFGAVPVPVDIDVHQTPYDHPPTPVRVLMNTATLGRRGSNHHRYRPASRVMGTSETQMALEPPEAPEEPPTTSNTLIVGPLVKRSAESIYTTLKRNDSREVGPVEPRKMMPLPIMDSTSSTNSSADSLETVKRVQL